MNLHPVRVTLQLSRAAYDALDSCSVREARSREEVMNAAVLTYNRLSDENYARLAEDATPIVKGEAS